MKRVSEIVTDTEIERVHGNANFGHELTKRQVVNQGILTYAFGYSSGHTQMTILREHKLITKPRGYRAKLTNKGIEYLHSLFYGVPLKEIMKLSANN